MKRTSRATLSQASLSVSQGGRGPAGSCFSMPPSSARAFPCRSGSVGGGGDTPPAVSAPADRSSWTRYSGTAAIAVGVAGGGDVAAPADSSLPAVAP